MEPWSVDEYARRLRMRSHPVHQAGGVWWRQLRTQFCWPLDPLAIVEPGATPALPHALFGYQARAEAAEQANSYLNPMMCEDVAGYALERLSSQRRNRIKRGLKQVEIRAVGEAELARDGWQIEHEFYGRTQWHPPPPPPLWQAQVRRSYSSPIVDHKLGAWVGDRLVAYLTWFGLEDTAHTNHLASSDEGNQLCANDALLYTWMEQVRASGRYRRATFSIRSLKATLDEYKESHLFRLQSLPARLMMNPLMRELLRWRRPTELERLVGLGTSEARVWIEEARRQSRS
jgi:hypothetical protein